MVLKLFLVEFVHITGTELRFCGALNYNDALQTVSSPQSRYCFTGRLSQIAATVTCNDNGVIQTYYHY